MKLNEQSCLGELIQRLLSFQINKKLMWRNVCLIIFLVLNQALKLKSHLQIGNSLAFSSFQLVQDNLGVKSLVGMEINFLKDTITFTGCYANKAYYNVTGDKLRVQKWQPHLKYFDDEYILRSLISKATSFHLDEDGILTLTNDRQRPKTLLILKKKEQNSATHVHTQSQNATHFEYREMMPTKVQATFNQFDIYFFKPNMTAVGVKVRLHKKNFEMREFNGLQVKVIKDIKKIPPANTELQQWEKLHIPINIEIYTKQYMKRHPKKFTHNKEETFQDVIEKELSKLNFIICDAIRTELQRKNYTINQNLQKWLNQDYPLEELYVVEKIRLKSKQQEKGLLKVYPLYDSNQKSSIWKTLEFEAKSAQQLISKLKQQKKGNKVNVSYPRLIQNIYLSVFG